MKNITIAITIIILEFENDSVLADRYEKVWSKWKKGAMEQGCCRKIWNEYIWRYRFNMDSENMQNDRQDAL